MPTVTPTSSAAVRPELRPLPAASTGAPAALLGLGSYLPSGVITNGDLEAMVDTSDTWILERTGIRERHRAGSGETASTMGAEAARRALAAAGNPAVDVLIMATCTPDTLFPSAACMVQRHLGLTGMPAFDVNAACSGFIYAVSIADALVRAGSARHVLVVAAEAMTSLVDYGDRSTCVLFGDGAGAGVVGPAPRGTGGIRAVTWGADGRDANLIYFGPPQNGEQRTDRVRMMGRGTFRLAVEHLCDSVERVCAEAGWRAAEVQHFVPHQANLRIIEAAAKRLGLPADRVVVNVDTVGNTSAASIPLALSGAAAGGRFHEGDRVLCATFGAGTTWAGLALEWSSGPAATS